MKKLILILLPVLVLASESKIEEITFYSDALGINKNFNILLPANYDATIQRYPVIYLFRGHENEWADPFEDNSRNGRNIKNVYDELIAAGVINEIIFVMPGVSSADNSIPGLGVNFKDVSLANNSDGIGTGKFEDYITADLIDYIDENFRTLNLRQFRALDGFSLGGYTSMNLITRHPELFISAGGYDGTLMWLDFDDLRREGENDDNTWLLTSMFDPAFGKPRDVEYMKRYNAANLIKYGSDAYLDSLREVQFLLHSSALPNGTNRTETEHFVDILAEKGINNVFDDIRLSEDAVHNWHFADLHVSETIPYHYQKFQEAENTLDLHFIQDFSGTEISGMANVSWDFPESIDSFCTILNFKNTPNQPWQRLAELTENEKSWQWNSENFRDGINYQIQIIVTSDSNFAKIESGIFTINNPGNAEPEIELIQPSEKDTVAGYFEIQWNGGDADGDDLEYSLLLSVDNGISWKPMAEELSNMTQYNWDSNLSGNSPLCKIILSATDGNFFVYDTSETFTIKNERWFTLLDSAEHISGNGSGEVFVSFIVEPLLYGHNYEITFDDTSIKTYSVKDLDSDEILIEKQPIPPKNVEGEMFNGVRLIINDFETAEIDQEKTGWEIGETNYKHYASLPTIDLGTEVIVGFPWPADYQIEFFDNIVDTSASAFGVLSIPLPFIVENITENSPADIIFIDNDYDGQLTRNDVIYFLEKNESDEWMICWMLTFSGNPSDEPPQPGDVFHLCTLKPFTTADVFRFGTGSLNVDSDEKYADKISLHSYPNPFNPTATIQFNLPKIETVKLSIYDLQGCLIKRITNSKMSVGKHRVIWDATDDFGQNVSSGIYFYHLNIGDNSITRKMTLIR